MRVALCWIFLFTACGRPEGTSAPEARATASARIAMTSSAFSDGGVIPAKYSCDGGDVIPPLSWSGAPAATRSFALVVDDPDAPGGTWDHWVLFDIPPTVTSIEEGKVPSGIVGTNSWKKQSWGGPCPPDREHRYFFKLYALDTLLRLPATSTKRDLEEAMKGHVIAEGQLIGKYDRKRR
jgi:Raf kinase inhibitor-like YbhB/YbcL family protein